MYKQINCKQNEICFNFPRKRNFIRSFIARILFSYLLFLLPVLLLVYLVSFNSTLFPTYHVCAILNEINIVVIIKIRHTHTCNHYNSVQNNFNFIFQKKSIQSNKIIIIIRERSNSAWACANNFIYINQIWNKNQLDKQHTRDITSIP